MSERSKSGDSHTEAMPGAKDRRITKETLKISTLEPTKAPPVEIGSVLGGRYEIERQLGEGGFGVVFAAFDKFLSERVALKILHPGHGRSWNWVKRLAREVKVARAIRHPNVCRVFEFSQQDGHWFITMELASGGSFREVLDKRSAIVPIRKEFLVSDLTARLQDARAVCAGLAAIHAVGIVHRDVTPANVLRMGDDRLVITDFGLAIGTDETTSFHGGTPKYMAPEVLARRPADQRSDVYQLGLLLHEIFFDKHPEWVRAADSFVLKSPAGEDDNPIEREVAQLCMECLSHNPDSRPANAVIVAGRLAAAEKAEPLSPITLAWRRVKRSVRKRIVWGPLLGIVLAVAAVQGGRVLIRPSPCSLGLGRAAAIWPADQEAHAKQKFLKTERPHAAATFALVTSLVRRHLDEWRSTYRVACRNPGSADRPNPTFVCLEDDMAGVRALVNMLTYSDAGDRLVDGAPHAVASLRAPARCQSAKAAATPPRPPTESRVREDVDAIRTELLLANPLAEGGEYSIAAHILQPLLRRAEATGYCPVIAETRLAEAQSLRDTGGPTYRSTLERALWMANGCAHDRVVAIAAAELVFADRFESETISSRWARMSETVLERIGGDIRIQSWLENNRANAASRRGRFSEAVDGYRHALEIKRLEVGSHHLEVGFRLRNLSDALKEAQRLDEALAANDEAQIILTRWLGPDHVDVGTLKSNRGDLLLDLRLVEQAEIAYREALAIFRSRLAPNDFRIPYPLAGLGSVFLLREDAENAIAPLEQALKMIGAEDRFFLSSVKFTLARALTKVGRNRTKAFQLAKEAADTYQEADGFRPRRKEIVVWIAANYPGSPADAVAE